MLQTCPLLTWCSMAPGSPSISAMKRVDLDSKELPALLFQTTCYPVVQTRILHRPVSVSCRPFLSVHTSYVKGRLDSVRHHQLSTELAASHLNHRNFECSFAYGIVKLHISHPFLWRSRNPRLRIWLTIPFRPLPSGLRMLF